MTKSRHIRRILKPDPEVLRHECEIERIPVEELTRRYGYKDVSNIYAWCRNWNITPYREPLPTDHLRQIDLSSEQLQVVLGTLLGDGSIRRDVRGGGRNDVLVIAHGERQRDYLEWKKKFLEPFILADMAYESAQRGFGIGRCRYTYHSVAHPTFTALRDLCYPNGVKTISRAWLNQLDARAIAFWLMDDGSYHRSRGYIHISTNAFTKEELCIAAEWFGDSLSVVPYIHSAGRKDQWSLAFSREASNHLREIVRPHFFGPLLYKIGF